MKTSCLLAALAAVVIGMPSSSMADPPLVYAVENTGASYPAPTLPTLGNLPFIQPLPDPFCWAADPINKKGTRSTAFSDWEHHRNEIAAQIENYEIGTKPVVNLTNIFASYSGGTTPGTSGTLTVRVTNYVSGVAKTLTLTCGVTIPSGAAAPYPVCIGMDSPYGSLTFSDFTSRHIAGITYSESQVSVYNNPSSSDPYYQLYPSLWNNSGQYSAWAWGVSRLIDGLTLLTNTLPMDLTHICVTGCSYAGKLALFSGAFDERIALTVAQESGGGGDTSWRYSYTEPAGSVEGLAQTSSQWFRSSMFQFGNANVSYLPEDHHMLEAMCAPRALLVTGNTDYTWLSNPSAYVCDNATAQIYATLGITNRYGYAVDGGHSHCAFPSDQETELQYFLDTFMLGETNVTPVTTEWPTSYPTTVNSAQWTAWWGTTNPVFPYVGRISLSIPTAATKGNGTLAGQGLVSTTPIPTNTSVTVTLTSGNPSLVTVPTYVVIPQGQTSAAFDLTILDNGLLEGDQPVTITANSAVAKNGAQNQQMTIHDNQSATLSVTLPASASESAGTLVNAGSVSMSTAAGTNIPIHFTASDPSALSFPTVTIPQGQTSAVFSLYVNNNNIIGGSENVTVATSVANWTNEPTSMTIFFNDSTPALMHFAWNTVPSPQLIGVPFSATLTAFNGANKLDYRLPVTVSALIAGNAPGTTSILNSPGAEQSLNDNQEYVRGYFFTPTNNLKVTDVLSYFGDTVSIWTASGQLLASQNVVSVPGTWVDTPLPTPLVLPAGATYLLMVHENGVGYYWSTDLPTTFPDGTINQSWWDWGNRFPTQTDGNQWYFVDLLYAKDFASVPVNPGPTVNLSGGIWSGNIAALQTATNMMLQANAGVGSSGFSTPFTVFGIPNLGTAVSGNSLVLSWPDTVAGFNLQQSSTLSNWTDVPVTPAVVGNSYVVTNTIGAGPGYFRLHKP